MLTLAATTPGEPEIFASLQGEGASVGQPCAFIRLSRCNLACVWCDTAYTWRFAGDNRPHRDELSFERGANQITLSEEDAAAQILALGQRRLVITGGEPLLQGAALARLAALLPEIRIEIETNGTVAPHPALDPLVAQYNVSPKLAHSGNPESLALLPERLAQWAADRRTFFKFVIAEPSDLDEVLALTDRFTIPRDRAYLMPEGRNGTTIASRGRWLAPLCLAHGFAYADRLHIHLYGDTRGT
jgi:7-carboxy-7-deazaguanine synthase